MPSVFLPVVYEALRSARCVRCVAQLRSSSNSSRPQHPAFAASPSRPSRPSPLRPRHPAFAPPSIPPSCPRTPCPSRPQHPALRGPASRPSRPLASRPSRPSRPQHPTSRLRVLRALRLCPHLQPSISPSSPQLCVLRLRAPLLFALIPLAPRSPLSAPRPSLICYSPYFAEENNRTHTLWKGSDDFLDRPPYAASSDTSRDLVFRNRARLRQILQRVSSVIFYANPACFPSNRRQCRLAYPARHTIRRQTPPCAAATYNSPMG